MANIIKTLWLKYTGWCDKMGLVPENQRCCVPKLTEENADKYLKQTKPHDCSVEASSDNKKTML